MQRENTREAGADHFGIWPYIAGILLGFGLMALMFGLAV